MERKESDCTDCAYHQERDEECPMCEGTGKLITGYDSGKDIIHLVSGHFCEKGKIVTAICGTELIYIPLFFELNDTESQNGSSLNQEDVCPECRVIADGNNKKLTELNDEEEDKDEGKDLNLDEDMFADIDIVLFTYFIGEEVPETSKIKNESI